MLTNNISNRLDCYNQIRGVSFYGLRVLWNVLVCSALFVTATVEIAIAQDESGETETVSSSAVDEKESVKPVVGNPASQTADNYTFQSDKHENSIVSVTAALEPENSVALSDDIVLIITVDFPPTAKVELVEWPSTWGTWTVVRSEWTDVPVSPLIRRTIKTTLRPSSLGVQSIPPVPIFYRESVISGTNKDAGVQKYVETEVLTIEVVSSIPQNAVSLTNIQSDNNILKMRGGWIPWIAIILGTIVISGLIWSFINSWRSKKKQVVKQSPQEWAVEQLNQLQASGLAQVDVKEFYIKLTVIIRRFIELTTFVNAPELTTEEFLVKISQGEVFSDVERIKLRSFLEQADMVKFARFRPEEATITNSIRLAEIFIGIQAE